MQNYYQQQQQQLLNQQLLHQQQQNLQQQQQTQLQSRRRTRSSHPDDINNNNNNTNINNSNNNIMSYNTPKQHPQPHSLSLLPHQPSHHSDIDSSRILIKQLTTNKPPQQRKSNWSRKQRIKHYIFLNYYSQIPHWGSDLKSIPTYKSLSIFIKTRSPQQCKSYHLSMRRNYKSIQQMIVGLREELREEDNFNRLVDKYEVDVIAFQMEYKLLEMYGLQEKGYFQQKLVQRSRRSNVNDNNMGDYQVVNNNNEEQMQKQEHNFKINLKDLLAGEQGQDHHQQDQKQKQKQKQKQENNNIRSNNNVNINSNKNVINNSSNQNIKNNSSTIFSQYGNNNNNNPIPNADMNTVFRSPFTTTNQQPQPTTTNTTPSSMNYFMPPQMSIFPPLTYNNKDLAKKSINNNNNNNKNNIPNNNPPNRQTPPPNTTTNNINNQRLYIQQLQQQQQQQQQQNYTRFLQANKTLYTNPYQQQYTPYPFIHPSQMQFNQQFRTQLPFSIPPPGGMGYMLHDPYAMGQYSNNISSNNAINSTNNNNANSINITNTNTNANTNNGNSKFGPSLVPKTYKQQKILQQQQNNNQNKLISSSNYQHPTTTTLKPKQTQPKYSQKRKQLLLECHKHWINWLRAVTEVNKRKSTMQQHQQQQHQQRSKSSNLILNNNNC